MAKGIKQPLYNISVFLPNRIDLYQSYSNLKPTASNLQTLYRARDSAGCWIISWEQEALSSISSAGQQAYTEYSSLRADNRRVIFGELFQSELFWRVFLCKLDYLK